MSVGSHPQNNKMRHLTQEEKNLIATLIEGTPYAEIIKEKLPSSKTFYKVFEMDDGKMGSLRFVQDLSQIHQLSSSIAEAEFLDEDNIPVSIVLNVDQEGNIYELDMWKVDFSPLKKFPTPSEVRLKS